MFNVYQYDKQIKVDDKSSDIKTNIMKRDMLIKKHQERIKHFMFDVS